MVTEQAKRFIDQAMREADPQGLIKKHGAPDDEYSHEVKLLVASMDHTPHRTPADLAKAIRLIFERQFDAVSAGGIDDYMALATKILDNLSQEVTWDLKG